MNRNNDSDSSWTYDTGEFIALHVPEEEARAKLQRRVNELKSTLTAIAESVHNKYHLRDDRNRAKTWETCKYRICLQARRTLMKEEELLL